MCPVCGKQVQSLGAGNVIKPFWLRIGQFFIYPAGMTPMMIMLAMAALVGLLSDTLLEIFLLVLLISFVKYAYVVLEDTAHGYVKPRKFEFSMLAEELELPFKQLFLIFCFGIVNSQIFDLMGPGAFTISAAMTVIAFPAAVMVLAIKHSFFRALNPLFLLLTIKRIGPAYFILCFFLSILLGGPYWLIDFVIEILPASMFQPVFSFIYMYFTLIMFNMMGYVLFQYHERLGFDIAQEYEESGFKTNATTTTDPRFRNVDILLQEGRLDDAEQKLIQAVKEHPGELAPREKLHKMHVMTRNIQGLHKYSADYIARLMHLNKPSEALRVFVESYHVDATFKVEGAKERHDLAKLLHANSQSRAALSLLNNLHVDYPSYEGIPSAYLMVAQILFEYFNEETKARQILGFLLKRYPAHAVQVQVREYLAVIDSMAVGH